MVLDGQARGAEDDLQAALKYFRVDAAMEREKEKLAAPPPPPSPPSDGFLDRSLRPTPLDISELEAEIDIMPAAFAENPDEICASSILFEPGSGEHSPSINPVIIESPPHPSIDDIALVSPIGAPLPSPSPHPTPTPSLLRPPSAGERRISMEDFVAEAEAEKTRLQGMNNIKSTAIQVVGLVILNALSLHKSYFSIVCLGSQREVAASRGAVQSRPGVTEAMLRPTAI
jgi:hypothetical protein